MLSIPDNFETVKGRTLTSHHKSHSRLRSRVGHSSGRTARLRRPFGEWCGVGGLRPPTPHHSLSLRSTEGAEASATSVASEASRFGRESSGRSSYDGMSGYDEITQMTLRMSGQV